MLGDVISDVEIAGYEEPPSSLERTMHDIVIIRVPVAAILLTLSSKKWEQKALSISQEGSNFHKTQANTSIFLPKF